MLSLCVYVCESGAVGWATNPSAHYLSRCGPTVYTWERPFPEQWIYTQGIQCYLTHLAQISWSRLNFSWHNFNAFYTLNLRKTGFEPASSYICETYYTSITWWTKHEWSSHSWDLPVVMFLRVLYQQLVLAWAFNLTHKPCHIQNVRSDNWYRSSFAFVFFPFILML